MAGAAVTSPACHSPVRHSDTAHGKVSFDLSVNPVTSSGPGRLWRSWWLTGRAALSAAVQKRTNHTHIAAFSQWLGHPKAGTAACEGLVGFRRRLQCLSL